MFVHAVTKLARMVDGCFICKFVIVRVTFEHTLEHVCVGDIFLFLFPAKSLSFEDCNNVVRLDQYFQPKF